MVDKQIVYLSKTPIESSKFKNSNNLEKAKTYLNKYKEIEFDSETTGLDFTCNSLLLYQFGAGDYRFVVDAKSFPIEEFKDLLEEKLLIIHNAKFDLKYLYNHRIVPSEVWDTMLAEKVLTTGRFMVSCSLLNVAKRRLGIILDKTIRAGFGKDCKIGEDEIVYSADDVAYLTTIKTQQHEEAEAEGLLNTISLENKFVLALAYIEYNGIGFSWDMWAAKCKEDKDGAFKYLEQLNSEVFKLNDPEFVFNGLFGTEITINWDAPMQVVKLFKKLGIETGVVDKKTGQEKDSVLGTLLETQSDKHVIVGLYLKYKKAQKLVTSFGENFKNYITEGRIFTEYTQILDTGRISCGGKGKDRDYPNMQQIPSDRRHRDCFRAKEGYNLIVADYSSQESRILVDVSQEKALLEFYLSGEADLHSYTAKLVYQDLRDVTLKEIKKNHADRRQIMKTVNFGLAYGGAATTIARNANIPLEVAEQVYNDYFKAFPDLKAYFEKAKRAPFERGYILINEVSGRKSYIDFFDKFLELEGKIDNRPYWTEYRKNKTPQKVEEVKEFFKYKGIIERKGLNYVIQGTAADMSKLAAHYLFSYLRKNNYLFKVYIPNIVHDEIHIECPIELADEMKGVLQKSMEEAGSVFCKTIPITAEVEVSDHWSK